MDTPNTPEQISMTHLEGKTIKTVTQVGLIITFLFTDGSKFEVGLAGPQGGAWLWKAYQA